MLKYSDFIGKRLDDAIKYMPDDAILHIGSRTGFLFVGDKAHYYRDIKIAIVDYGFYVYQSSSVLLEPKLNANNQKYHYIIAR